MHLIFIMNLEIIYCCVILMLHANDLVLWSFKSVVCMKDCGSAAVYRYAAIELSFIPFTGISNFYSGNNFSAVFEVIEGVVVLILICSCCCCYHDHSISDDEKESLLAMNSVGSFILTAINILRCIICEASAGSFELNYEFSLMLTTLVITVISCCCGCAEKRSWVVTTFINIIVIGVMEVARDVYVATTSENDGNGCPFIET